MAEKKMTFSQAIFRRVGATAQRTFKRFDRGLRHIERHPSFRRLEALIQQRVAPLVERLEAAGFTQAHLSAIERRLYRQTQRKLVRLLSFIRTYYPDFRIEDYIDVDHNPLLRSYLILGVPYGATLLEVKHAYRQLMRRYHPDRHTADPEQQAIAHEMSQRIIKAYEIIEQHMR